MHRQPRRSPMQMEVRARRTIQSLSIALKQLTQFAGIFQTSDEENPETQPAFMPLPGESPALKKKLTARVYLGTKDTTHGEVAQSVEQWTENPRVLSSILSLATRRSRDCGPQGSIPSSFFNADLLIPRLQDPGSRLHLSLLQFLPITIPPADRVACDGVAGFRTCRKLWRGRIGSGSGLCTFFLKSSVWQQQNQGIRLHRNGQERTSSDRPRKQMCPGLLPLQRAPLRPSRLHGESSRLFSQQNQHQKILTDLPAVGIRNWVKTISYHPVLPSNIRRSGPALPSDRVDFVLWRKPLHHQSHLSECPVSRAPLH